MQKQTIIRIKHLNRFAFLWLGALTLSLFLSGCKSGPQTNPESAATTSAPTRPQSSEQVEPRRARSRRGRPNAQAAPGDFDFYLLNLSWSPEFCAAHTNSAECGHGLGFVVHGLWPQDNTGDYPENCSNAPGPTNPQAYTDLIPTVSLIQHEWTTHGTCSGVAADAFFAAVRTAYNEVKIPAGIGTGAEASGVTPQQFLATFAKANPSFPPGSIALSCGNNQLTAVEICMTKSLQPEPCQGVRSCRANSIGITPQ